MRPIIHTATVAILAGSLSFVPFGCAADSTSHDESARDGVPGAAGDSATNGNSSQTAEVTAVHGHIVDMPADAIVTVHQVTESGELRRMDDCSCKPDESGHYEVPLPELPNLEGGPLIVMVEVAGEVTGSVMVSLEGAIDGVIKAAPIDVESTVEVDAFAATGFSLDASELATLKLVVDAELAAAAAAASDYTTQVKIIADGALAAAIAFETALESQIGTQAHVVLETAEQLLIEAQAELQASLAAASSEAEIQAALEIYAEAFVEAYLASGCTPEEVSAAAHAAVNALVIFSADLTAEAKAAALAQVHAVLAAAIHACIEAKLVALGATSASLELLAEAQATLMAEITAAAKLGIHAKAHIEAAFAAYAETCGAILESTVNLGLSTVAELKALVASLETTLAATLESCTGEAIEVGVTVGDACGGYFVDAEAAIEGSLVAELVSTEAELEALATIVAELSLID